MRILATLLFLGMFAPVWAADCDTNLKPTDTYKELSAKLKCLNDRIISFEHTGNSAQKTNSARNTAPVIQAQEVAGIKFELEGCFKLKDNISCRFFMTATANDDEIYLNAQSRSVNQDGTVLMMSGYQGRGEREIERFTCNSCNISRKLIKDARTSGAAFFKVDPENVSEVLSAVQLKLSGQYAVTFRNIVVN